MKKGTGEKKKRSLRELKFAPFVISRASSFHRHQFL
jgi:hypothetical protein